MCRGHFRLLEYENLAFSRKRYHTYNYNVYAVLMRNQNCDDFRILYSFLTYFEQVKIIYMPASSPQSYIFSPVLENVSCLVRRALIGSSCFLRFTTRPVQLLMHRLLTIITAGKAERSDRKSEQFHRPHPAAHRLCGGSL